MHRITLLLLIVLLIPDLYIYFTYIIRKVKNALLRFSYWIPTLLLGLLYIYFMFLTGDNALSHHPLGIGRLAIAIMLFAVPKLLFMLVSATGNLLHFLIQPCPRRPFTTLGIILAIISFGCIAYGSFIGTTRFDVKEVEYASQTLPAGFDG